MNIDAIHYTAEAYREIGLQMAIMLAPRFDRKTNRMKSYRRKF